MVHSKIPGRFVELVATTWYLCKYLSTAGVAKLADALGLGPSPRKGVEVRVLSPAPKNCTSPRKRVDVRERASDMRQIR